MSAANSVPRSQPKAKLREPVKRIGIGVPMLGAYANSKGEVPGAALVHEGGVLIGERMGTGNLVAGFEGQR